LRGYASFLKLIDLNDPKLIEYIVEEHNKQTQSELNAYNKKNNSNKTFKKLSVDQLANYTLVDFVKKFDKYAPEENNEWTKCAVCLYFADYEVKEKSNE